jgi:peptidoglycan/xylan/chitin deacetylase (PgdA/CDA1 family)
MHKLGKVLVSAVMISMLAAVTSWANTQMVVITQSEAVAPPGSEGTVLSPVITAGGQSQSAQDGGPGASAGEEQGTQETQTASTGRTIDPSKPMVALTFDDGPQTSVGNQIMDCLAQYGGKATFFMVGERVAAHATEVRRMVAEGHEVANHTMNHKYLQKLSAGEIQSQVNSCNDAIQSICGVRPTLLRLPGGNHNATVLANTGMPMIQWNIDTLDWKTRNTASTVSTVLNNVKDGDIVLMHELYTATGNAAVQIIPELVNRGYQLVTVSEMAAAKGYSLEAGKLYSSFK